MNEFQQLVIHILGIGSIGALLQNNLFYQLFLEKLRLEVKPFNCALCLTFWLSTPFFMVNYGVLNGLMYGALTSIFAELLDRKLQL